MILPLGLVWRPRGESVGRGQACISVKALMLHSSPFFPLAPYGSGEGKNLTERLKKIIWVEQNFKPNSIWSLLQKQNKAIFSFFFQTIFGVKWYTGVRFVIRQKRFFFTLSDFKSFFIYKSKTIRITITSQWLNQSDFYFVVGKRSRKEKYGLRL